MDFSLEPDEDDAPEPVVLTVPAALAGERLDKALAAAAVGLPGLSRSALVRLIGEGRARDPEGRTVTEPRAKVKPGDWRIELPPPLPSHLEPEAIPLHLVYEDDDLVVVDKPAGMVVHPAPGAENGTLVNALLHHCGEGLTGIGAERRPGIVHRIDKDTSGLLVVAKTAAAHEALARQFAAHEIERRYLGICWGVPDPASARLSGLPGVHFEGRTLVIDRPIARHPVDRKRMAVRQGGRRAVTRIDTFEGLAEGLVALVECRLETGRTHQIRVHAAHVGHPLVGDPVYGRARSVPASLPADARQALTTFPRQALHAAKLGFTHPRERKFVSFEAQMPQDMAALLRALQRNPRPER